MLPGEDIYGTKAECDRLQGVIRELTKRHVNALVFTFAMGVALSFMIFIALDTVFGRLGETSTPVVKCWRLVRSNEWNFEVTAFGLRGTVADPIERHFKNEATTRVYIEAWHQKECAP